MKFGISIIYWFNSGSFEHLKQTLIYCPKNSVVEEMLNSYGVEGAKIKLLSANGIEQSSTYMRQDFIGHFVGWRFINKSFSIDNNKFGALYSIIFYDI